MDPVKHEENHCEQVEKKEPHQLYINNSVGQPLSKLEQTSFHFHQRFDFVASFAVNR